MNSKPIERIGNILKVVTSLVLCVCATVSMLGATLINVGRDYINSDDFSGKVNTADLSTVTFLANGEKTTVGEYMKAAAKEYIGNQNKYFFVFSNEITDKAVDQLLTSDFVNKVVKAEVLYLVDFFMNSDADAAQERLDNGEPVDVVLELDPQNAKSIEDAVRIYMRSFVVTSLEKTSKMSSDTFVVFLSEKTVTKLVLLSVLFLILIIVVNHKSIFNVLLYGGFSSILCGIIIKFAQSKFDEMNTGLEDLVGYVFLKPLADTYSTNAVLGFILGFILIALFIAILYFFKPQKLEESQETE